MNVLPRLLYPLQMLPLSISKNINKDLERSLSKFTWHGKRPRESFSSLQLPEDKGGLAVPNMLFYNWACHIRTLWTWLHSYLRLETCVDSWASSLESLCSLVTCKPEKIKINIKHKPPIMNSIKVWQEISEYMDRRGVKSMLSYL